MVRVNFSSRWVVIVREIVRAPTIKTRRRGAHDLTMAARPAQRSTSRSRVERVNSGDVKSQLKTYLLKQSLTAINFLNSCTEPFPSACLALSVSLYFSFLSFSVWPFFSFVMHNNILYCFYICIYSSNDLLIIIYVCLIWWVDGLTMTSNMWTSCGGNRQLVIYTGCRCGYGIRRRPTCISIVCLLFQAAAAAAICTLSAPVLQS